MQSISISNGSVGYEDLRMCFGPNGKGKLRNAEGSVEWKVQ